MRTFETFTDSGDAVADYPIRDVPAHLQERWRQYRSSPSDVDKVVKLAELIYANKDQFDREALELAGGLFSFATVNAFHGLQSDNRGNKIVQAIRRDLGEEPPVGISWPEPSADPQPKPDFVIEPPKPAEEDEPA